MELWAADGRIGVFSVTMVITEVSNAKELYYHGKTAYLLAQPQSDILGEASCGTEMLSAEFLVAPVLVRQQQHLCMYADTGREKASFVVRPESWRILG